jgi:hypothetical protein
LTDPISTIGLGAVAAYLAKDGVSKLLGPTADYLGNGLKEFTRQRSEAVGKIFSSAYRKLGQKVDSPGTVPPKVLKAVINEGSYSNDPLAIEYFGGILASARTEEGRDDRSARLAKTVDGLSTYQLRAHYLIYSTIRDLFLKKELTFNMDDRPKMQFFVTLESFIEGMALSQKEKDQFPQLLSHILFGLHADSLIGPTMKYGQQDGLKDVFPAVPAAGIILEPSTLGAELYLSAFGFAEKPREFLFSEAFSNKLEGITAGFTVAIPTKI